MIPDLSVTTWASSLFLYVAGWRIQIRIRIRVLCPNARGGRVVAHGGWKHAIGP